MEAVEDTAERKKDALSSEALAWTVAAIDDLVAADRLLAVTLLDELDGLVAAEPARQDKVDRELGRA